MKNKIVSAADALAIVRDGDTVAMLGFCRQRHARRADRSRWSGDFSNSGSPRDLTLVFAAAPGDGKDRGLNRLAHEAAREARHRRSLGAGAEALRAGGEQPRSRPTTCRSAR